MFLFHAEAVHLLVCRVVPICVILFDLDIQPTHHGLVPEFVALHQLLEVEAGLQGAMDGTVLLLAFVVRPPLCCVHGYTKANVLKFLAAAVLFLKNLKSIVFIQVHY